MPSSIYAAPAAILVDFVSPRFLASPLEDYSKRSSPPPRRSLAFTGSCGPTYAFLDLVAEVGIYTFYSHPAVRADLIIAPPAEIRSDEVLLLKSLERIVHRVVR